MPMQIYNYLGQTNTRLVINNVTESKVSRTIVHDLPLADYDILQYMGTTNRQFIMKGCAYIDNNSSITILTLKSYLETLVGQTGSLVSDLLLPQTQVFFSDVDIEDRGSRPMEIAFTITAVEVI